MHTGLHHRLIPSLPLDKQWKNSMKKVGWKEGRQGKFDWASSFPNVRYCIVFRYKENRAVLKMGMANLGFRELVPEANAGHIITCFYYPEHSNFSFEKFYQKLSDMGLYKHKTKEKMWIPLKIQFSDQVIYPGKVTDASCFRIGNIGDLNVEDIGHLVECIKKVLIEMEVPMPGGK